MRLEAKGSCHAEEVDVFRSDHRHADRAATGGMESGTGVRRPTPSPGSAPASEASATAIAHHIGGGCRGGHHGFTQGTQAHTLTAGVTRTGLPIGLQVIGPYLEDRTPIRFAALVAQEWGGFRPPPGYDVD
jgi:hypothetical protein